MNLYYLYGEKQKVSFIFRFLFVIIAEKVNDNKEIFD